MPLTCRNPLLRGSVGLSRPASHIRAMGLLTLMCTGTFASWNQCPVFVGTNPSQGSPRRPSHRIGSNVWGASRRPRPIQFWTALPAATGVVVDWGMATVTPSAGGTGPTPFHTHIPDQWRTYTITVTTTACPGSEDAGLRTGKPGACWFTGTATRAAPPLRDSRKSTSTSPSAAPGISLSTGRWVRSAPSPCKTS